MAVKKIEKNKSEKAESVKKEVKKEVKGFKVKLPTVEEMLESGVHFGHQARRWHPRMEGFIFDKKKNIHILDLYKSRECLESACKYLYDVASKGGSIIFVGTKKQARDIVQLEARRAGAMYITERWVGGTITNFQTIRKNIDKLKEFMRKKEAGELSRYTKKERLLIDREIAKLQTYVGGILNLSSKPDALFIVDVRKEKTAVREAKRAKVPVVALVDTNSDPESISFVIPGNDDAIRSIALVVKAIADSVEDGYKHHADVLKNPPVLDTEEVVIDEKLLEVAEELEDVLSTNEEEKIPVVPVKEELPKDDLKKDKPAKKRGRPKKIEAK